MTRSPRPRSPASTRTLSWRSARRATFPCSPARTSSTDGRRSTSASASRARRRSRNRQSSPLSRRDLRYAAVALLSVEHLTKRFGGIVAVDDVSLAVEQGQIVGLIGPNGAGKTTLFNLITRLYRPDSGEIFLAGNSLLRTPAYRVVRRGIARTFQTVELFPSMTVLENVQIGGHARGDRPADEVLEELGLESVARRSAAGLPFGTMKRVELARALASRPRLLLLD